MKCTDFFYGTTAGRRLLSMIMKHHWDVLAVRFLCSPLSKPLVSWYIHKYHIVLTAAQKRCFYSFQEFFARTRDDKFIDATPEHLISPCDSWLSVFPIDSSSRFAIKHSYYRVSDLIQDAKLAECYEGGVCMIFRLGAEDYHHYCYIDNGYQGEHHEIPGVLHSVQPVACQQYPVYVLNRRCWSLLTTEHFGPVVQTEIGALIVGGIANNYNKVHVLKGMEKGHFELAGSTIVLLFEKGRVALLPELRQALEQHDEVRVKQGMWIGFSISSMDKKPSGSRGLNVLPLE